jgi:hypothetical protein
VPSRSQWLGGVLSAIHHHQGHVLVVILEGPLLFFGDFDCDSLAAHRRGRVWLVTLACAVLSLLKKWK